MIHNINNAKSIIHAYNIINKGGVIIYPTDTLYGIGVDATNTKAIQILNNLKSRIQAYSIIVSTKSMLEKYAVVNAQCFKEIDQYLPGPFTMILNKKESNLSNLVSLKLETIGIRIPNHFFPIKLVESLNKPIITTSVNIHTQKSLYNLEEMQSTFKNIDIFFDENLNNNSRGSTIIDLTNNSRNILRQGDGIYN